MNALSKEESDRIVVLLEKHVRHSKLSQREMERQLGLSQGYLGGVLKGRIQLKVSHVYGIARILKMEPLYFFLHASPPESLKWLVEELGIGKNVQPSHLLEAEPLPSRQGMLEIIRLTIREELDRIFGETAQG